LVRSPRQRLITWVSHVSWPGRYGMVARDQRQPASSRRRRR